jgi:hypothetical protein
VLSDDFYSQQADTDGTLRVEQGFYPGDHGPDSYAVRVMNALTNCLIIEAEDVSLVQKHTFDTHGVVTLLLTRDGVTRVPVRIDSRSSTCAFHPLHEEPLERFNERLRSFWPIAPSMPAPQLAPAGERKVKLLAMLSLVFFAGIGIYSVWRFALSSPALPVWYAVSFVGMLITVLLFASRRLYHRK